MIRFALPLIAVMTFTACVAEQDATGYPDPAVVFDLTRMDGAVVAAPSSLQFTPPGAVSGNGPCNRFSGQQTLPYPAFRLGPILSTRRGCPDLSAEFAFFEALRVMTMVQVTGGQLVLSNEAGRSLVFEAR